MMDTTRLHILMQHKYQLHLFACLIAPMYEGDHLQTDHLFTKKKVLIIPPICEILYNCIL